MLEKTIKSVLKKKIAKWLGSIEDEKVRQIASDNLVITGGCIPSLMTNEQPKDIDMYFRTKEAVMAVAQYYVDRFNEEHGPILTNINSITKAAVVTGEMFEEDKEIPGKFHIIDDNLKEILGRDTFYTKERDNTPEGAMRGLGMTRMIANCSPDRVKIFVSSDGVAGDLEEANGGPVELGADPVDILNEADAIPAEVFEGERKAKKPYRPVFLSTNAITLSDGVQIVVRFYGDPKDIHETYDFVHTRAYYTPQEGLVIPKEVYEAVHNKTLIYTGSKYPVCSAVRIRKFISRGWTINAGQILKMAMQISELDLQNIDVLEDQLVGVDSLYFTQLIMQFRKQQEKNESWTYDSGYVMSVVDKIFG